MTRHGSWSRRRLFAATLGATGLPGTALLAQESDRGIGGTGAAPAEREDGERGIGGTGVVGTLRGFGSILVNGLRITFPRAVRVRIDGRPARLGDLAIGHVVQVPAQRHEARLATHLIEVLHEVSGPIEALAPDGFTVLGQTVIVPDARLRRAWRVRGWVAVSGLRRRDGTIVASLVEPCRPGTVQVGGVPTRDPGGRMRVGTLPLEGLADELAGQRVHLSGRLDAGRLVVEHARPRWPELLAERPDRLSIEDYVAVDDGAVRLASGLPSAGNWPIEAVSGETRAVVSATVLRDGHIEIDAVRPVSGSRSSGGGTSRANDAAPAGRPRDEGTGPARGGMDDPGGGRGLRGPGADGTGDGRGSGGGRPAGRGGPGGGSGGGGPGRGGGSRP